MASALLCAALAAVLLCSAAAAPVSLASLNPPKITVSVTGFMADGHKMAGTLAKSPNENAPGTPTLQASMDAVMVGYTMQPMPSVTSVSLWACYSKPSAYDRPWRAANVANLAKDKQCSVNIAENLPAHQGNATWEIGENVPFATYFVRAYGMCGKTICAYGNSTGFFQVNAVDPRPPAVIGATIGVMLFGPLVLAGFFIRDRVMGKQH